MILTMIVITTVILIAIIIVDKMKVANKKKNKGAIQLVLCTSWT